MTSAKTSKRGSIVDVCQLSGGATCHPNWPLKPVASVSSFQVLRLPAAAVTGPMRSDLMCEIGRGLFESDTYTRERMVAALNSFFLSVSFLGHRSFSFVSAIFMAPRSAAVAADTAPRWRIVPREPSGVLQRSHRGTSVDVQFGAL